MEPPVDGLLFLLDGNNMAYRAFFALPQEIATSSGLHTNALYGFSAMIIKILSDYRPTSVIVAWDSPGKTFRHEDFEEYKAQRKPMPEALSEQWPLFPEVCAAFGFVNLSVPGYEADDILATLAREAEADKRHAIIVTGDRDALQLVGPYVRVMSNTRGVTDVKVYDSAAVLERFGVTPEMIPDYIGLKGDTSDNIPGVPGIGEKTAAQLLGEFGTLERVLASRDKISGAKRRSLLEEHEELARLSKRLASLDRDAPIDMHAAEVLPHRPRRDRLLELFSRLEFTSLLERLEPLLPPASVEAGIPVGSCILPDCPQAGESWASLFDLNRPIGVAAEHARTAAGPLLEEASDSIWLAQPPAGPGSAAYESYVIANQQSVPGQESQFLDLLTQVDLACHDFKSASGLHDLVDYPGHDTFIAGYLLDPGRRDYRLDDLAAQLAVPVPASGPSAGAREAALVLPVAERQREALQRQGMWQLFQEIELPLTRVLIDMETTGVYVDCERLGEMAGKIQDHLEEVEACIYELAGEEFNLGSPQQLGRILFECLGLPRQRKTKTGYSTDAKTLEALREAHPIVEHLLNHRELSKLVSTYLLTLPQAVDARTGRLHTTFHQTIAATGRLSSSDPNLQNIPVRTTAGAQIRQCFAAPEGRALVVADYSQIELRIMAHLSGEPTLLEAFARGDDIHTRTAAEVFGLAEHRVDAAHRRYAKAVNFGIMYGISAFGLSQNLGISREDAGAYIERYFERMPRVKEFIERTIQKAQADGYVTTLFGRRRPIPELVSAKYQERSLGERLAVNSVIQGTAADIIKVAMIRCHGRLDREFPDARLVMQVHDELVFETPADEAADLREAIIEEMVSAFAVDPPLGVDAGIGSDWVSAK